VTVTISGNGAPQTFVSDAQGQFPRGIHDGLSRTLLGIGVNEKTSVVVKRDGKAHVIGESGAYLVLVIRRPIRSRWRQCVSATVPPM
jgi:cyanophycinase-like exopeptidase